MAQEGTVNTMGRLLDITRSREFLMFFAILLVYMANPVVVSSNDATPARLLPISIIREHNLDLNEFTFLYETRMNTTLINGRIVSRYPIFTAILVLPVYLIPVLMGLDPQSNNVMLLAKLSAALITAISCLFIYWTIKKIAKEKTALLITAIYAFGTANWPISSQDLWQHGPGELFIALTTYLLVRGLKEEECIKYAGATLSMAVAIRPANGIIALVLTAYVSKEHRKQLTRYLLYATPIALAVMAYSQTYLHSLTLMGQLIPPTDHWNAPFMEGLTGLLLSPSRGLLSYSPVLILSFFGMAAAWLRQDGPENTQMRWYGLAASAFIMLWSKWYAWHGVAGYGPRYLIEVLPFLCVFMAGPLEKMLEKRKTTAILLVLIAMSFYINFIGVAEADGSWEFKNDIDGRTYEVYWNPNGKGALELGEIWWNTSDMEWVYYSNRFFARISNN